MPKLNEASIDTIIEYFTGHANANLIPAVPENFRADLQGLTVRNETQLTYAELQLIFACLEAQENYEESATKFVVVGINSAPGYPINLTAGVVSLNQTIIKPTLTYAERRTIKEVIYGISNLGIVSPQQQTNLFQLLCTMSLSQAHRLPQVALQDILATLNEKGREIQVKNFDPIDLSAADARQKIVENIIHPVLTAKDRVEKYQVIEDMARAKGLLTEKVMPSNLNKLLSKIVPIDTARHALNDDELRMLLTAFTGNDSKGPQHVIIAIPKQYSGCFWGTKATVVDMSEGASLVDTRRIVSTEREGLAFRCCYFWRREIEHYEFPATQNTIVEISNQLAQSRGQLRDRMTRLKTANIMSGLLIGGVVAILEGIRESVENGSDAEKAFHYLLLIFPIILGFISAICSQFYSNTIKDFECTTRSLNKLGIKTDNEESPEATLTLANLPAGR